MNEETKNKKEELLAKIRKGKEELARLEKEVNDTFDGKKKPLIPGDVPEGCQTYEEFCKEQDYEKDEKSALDYKNFRRCRCEKSALTGKYKVIMGGSVLCVCDHPTKALAVLNALTRTSIHMEVETLMKKIPSGLIDSMCKKLEKFVED